MHPVCPGDSATYDLTTNYCTPVIFSYVLYFDVIREINERLQLV